MIFAPSVLSLIAAGCYGIVALAAMLAFHTAWAKRQVVWHRNAWVFVAALFIGLAMVRALALEEWVRHALRTSDWIQDNYAQRHAFQAPILAALIICGGLAGWHLSLRFIPGLRGRRNLAAFAALAATGGLMLLVLVRLVSLHSVDQLLYGPLKLNWFLDLGTAGMVLFCALAYVAVVRGLR